MESISTQLRKMEAANQVVVTIVGRLCGEVADRDRWVQTRYRDRCTVEAEALFAAHFETRKMIRAAIHAMKVVAAELDESIGEVVGVWELPGLTNNVVFQESEE